MRKIITLTFLAVLLKFAAFAQCPILGSLSTCIGSSTYLHIDSSAFLCSGGTWYSTNTAIATINTTTGYAYGVAVGTDTISYTVGSTTSTVVITVSAAPTAIMGGDTSICPGSTIALANATPGGTWSSDATYIATVNAATGVVTGASYGGTATISYTLASGCAAITTINVATTTLYDSITGGSAGVCPGSHITLTITTTGGHWSSSDTAIATIDSNTGVVTGVLAGTVSITYSKMGTCGMSYDVTTLVVNTGTTPGAISGATTTVVGSSAMVYESVSGGTWSSTNTGIATVDSSGNVYGVSTGIDTIKYTVMGCSGTAYTTTTFSVTALNGISGTVYFNTGILGYYNGNVKVYLIHYNPSTLDLEAIDSSIVAASGASVNYIFTGLATDSFRVKAATQSDSMGLTTGFIPTYHDSSYYWHNATVIYHTSGTSDIHKNIYMAEGTATSGIGFIAGNVMSGANKGTSGTVPVVGMLIFVIDSATHKELQRTYTDGSGNYSFSNLPVGKTYTIYPEAINYATTAYTQIHLTATNDSMNAAKFIQHTVSKTITPIVTGINNLENCIAVTINVYPNPTAGILNINSNVGNTEKFQLTVTDITGKEMYTTDLGVLIGHNQNTIDLSNLSNGLYFINISSASYHYYTKVEILK